MTRSRETRAWMAYAVCLLLSAPAMPAAAQSGPLVTPAWLEARLDDSSIRIVDLGKTPEQFTAGHIPNSHYVDWRSEIVDPDAAVYFAVAAREAIETLLSRLGVDGTTTIVLYDSQSSRIAARTFWVLRYYGHGDVRILDGGADAWVAAGGMLSAETPHVAPTQYRVSRVHDEIIADLDDVADAIGRSPFTIVDARAPQFYTGEAFGSQFGSDTPNAKAGHVPGARNVFWASHFNDDGTFKSMAELRALYEAQGITPDRQIITYCHVGLQASTPWFVLKELLAYPNVRLYDRSMAEWANAQELPMAATAQ